MEAGASGRDDRGNGSNEGGRVGAAGGEDTRARHDSGEVDCGPKVIAFELCSCFCSIFCCVLYNFHHIFFLIYFLQKYPGILIKK
jgi:hypothetical protein